MGSRGLVPHTQQGANISSSSLASTIILSLTRNLCPVRRQRLWDQSGDLNNGEFLAHRNPKESEDEPEILRPTRLCASRKAGPRYSPRHESQHNLTSSDVSFGRGQTILLERMRIKRRPIQHRRLMHHQDAA